MTRATAGFRGRETAPPQATIQAVQRQARAKYLVGRERELRRFADLIAAGNAPRILFLHGPGGIGKSSLLEGFRNTARQLDRKFNYLDARLLPARPDAVSRAIDQVLAEPHAGEGPRVLALDHTEQLAALDGWLRTELLPGLPAGIVLVVAGRHRPGPQWHADPGLGELLIDIELVPLEPTAVSEYLQRRNVPDKHSAAVREFARGHPLALALAVDRILREPGKPFDAAGSPDLIQSLVGWLLRDVDEPRRLDALAACATVRSMNEPMLSAMLDHDTVRAEFNWLAGQHFVDWQANGLVIHDLVREVIVRDLRGRNLEYHHTLIRRAASHLLAGLETADQHATLQAIGDTIYALRHEPYVRRQFPFSDDHCYPDTARPEEIPALRAEVARLEGGESAAWFDYWLEDEGSTLMVMRGSGSEPVGLALVILFGAAEVAAGSDDPCAQALFRHLQRHAPLRGGEQVMLARFLLAHDTHQARTPVWAEMVSQLNGLMFTPGITLLGYVSDLAFDWDGIAEHANAWILPDSKYQLAGRDYGITAHDLRREPPLEWARNCVERILRNGEAPELQPSEVVLLEETAFADAVVEALHAFCDDAALARSPLLHSPVLRRYRSRRDPDALRGLIQETSAAQLSAPRRPCTLHEVLEQVYFVPVGKHRSAAEVLHVSERTLRRRLREAESRLTDALWRLETAGIHHGTPVARE